MKKKLHPFSIFFPFFNVLSTFITPMLFLLIISPDQLVEKLTNRVAVNWVVSLSGVILIFGFFKWNFFSYIISDKDITIFSGIVNKSQRKIVLNKIQSNSITPWVPSKLLNCANLYLQLEGTDSESSINFIGISIQDSNKILNLVKQEGFDKLVEEEQNQVPLMSITLNIIHSVIISSILIFFSAIADLFSDYDLDYIDSEIVLDLFINIPSRVYFYILLLAVFSLCKNLLKYSKFIIKMNEHVISISSGFVIKKRTSISKKNVSGLVIQESIIQRMVNRSSIYLESSERGDKKILFHPFINNKDISKLLTTFYGEELDIKRTKKFKQELILGVFIRSFIIVVLLSSLLNLFFQPIFALMYLCLIIICIYKILAYLTVSFVITPNYLYLRKGVLSRRTFIMNSKYYNKITIKKPFWLKKHVHIKLGYFNSTNKKNIRIRGLKNEQLSSILKGF